MHKEKRFDNLSKALRDNLLKRKAQQRCRKDDAGKDNLDNDIDNALDKEDGGEESSDASQKDTDGGHNRD